MNANQYIDPASVRKFIDTDVVRAIDAELGERSGRKVDQDYPLSEDWLCAEILPYFETISELRHELVVRQQEIVSYFLTKPLPPIVGIDSQTKKPLFVHIEPVVRGTCIAELVELISKQQQPTRPIV